MPPGFCPDHRPQTGIPAAKGNRGEKGSRSPPMRTTAGRRPRPGRNRPGAISPGEREGGENKRNTGTRGQKPGTAFAFSASVKSHQRKTCAPIRIRTLISLPIGQPDFVNTYTRMKEEEGDEPRRVLKGKGGARATRRMPLTCLSRIFRLSAGFIFTACLNRSREERLDKGAPMRRRKVAGWREGPGGGPLSGSRRRPDRGSREKAEAVG